MGPSTPDVPEQVAQFAPKNELPRKPDDALDQAGETTIAMIQQAANLSNERCIHAMDAVHKVSMQLRAAKDHIKQLQAERDYFQDSAKRGEEWLTRIYHKVKEGLLSPRGEQPPSSEAMKDGEEMGIENGLRDLIQKLRNSDAKQ
jgi:hypothetical protein